jgi:hypothetical protein
MTGMRVGTISEIVNGKGISFNKVQLTAIMVALRIYNYSDIIEVRLPEDIKEQYDRERKEWIDTKEMPISLKEMYRDNMMKSTLGKLQ